MLDETGQKPIAEIQELRVAFRTKDGPVMGVENVSFSINAGETVCVTPTQLAVITWVRKGDPARMDYPCQTAGQASERIGGLWERLHHDV